MKTHSVRISRARAPSARRRKWQTLAAVALITLPSASLVNAQGVTYTVNSTSDDVLGTDCTDRNGICTLRAAIQTANGHVGADTIDFSLPAGSVINLTQALPDLSDSVSLTGPGADKLTVRRIKMASTEFRIFKVTATGLVTFSGLTMSNGTTSVGGGILNESNGTVNVTNSTLTSNNSGTDGGGIWNHGTLNVINSMLDSNGAEKNGGAVYSNSGTVNVTNSTISGNRATGNSSSGHGGGIYGGSGTVNVTNSTLSGNSAEEGGGIYMGGGALNVSNSTLSGNMATLYGGGIEIEIRGAASASVKSSLIAMNSGAGCCSDVDGPITSQGFNLIGINDGAVASFPAGNPNANNDIVGTVGSPVNPQLDPNGLQDNGGPTQTIALQPGSPALDQGTSNSLKGNLNTDQRGTGFPRTADHSSITNTTGGDGTDIGAFEFGGVLSTPATLANISTRLRVETGDNVLIGGFIITGTQPKKVIVRGIGTSLPFADRLANPTLELRDSSGALLDSNDNWADSPNKQAIIDSTIPPSNDLESAIVATLPANNAGYTAIVRGVGGGTGIGVVEAYDLDSSVDSKLANIATRGLVQTGDNVLIAGTIVVGQSSQKVIVRAIGPSLPVPGKMDNPTLELRDSNGGLIRSNDDWRTGGQEAEIIATTIPPANDLESAIVATLPGSGASYTAIVRGVNGTTGIAVVEVYALN